MAKSIFDWVFSAALLILLSPLFVLLVATVLLFDGRPVFFKQQRVGLGGLEFFLFKFRTMVPCPATNEVTFDAGSSLRVTTLGSMLRRSKFDEIPQLFNVLRGEMSLVGPRPEIRKWVDTYPQRWKKIHRVKPGITDPASIYYRNEELLLAGTDDPEEVYRLEVLPHKLDLYEKYVDERSMWVDVQIIFKTIVALFR